MRDAINRRQSRRQSVDRGGEWVRRIIAALVSYLLAALRMFSGPAAGRMANVTRKTDPTGIFQEVKSHERRLKAQILLGTMYYSGQGGKKKYF